MRVSQNQNKIRIPNFICLGAQKAGTTTLHDILKQHPQIFLPQKKEAPFFSWEERYAKGMDWWLETFFADYNNEKILGVMTPEYIYYEEVPNRILEHCDPDVKLIIILRQPLERSYSHYLMSKRRGIEPLSFIEAIEHETERISKGDYERLHYSYVSRSRYAEQIKRYQALFDPKQILFLNFENDIRTNISATIDRIQTFLEVDKVELDTEIKSNPASEMRSKTAQQLFVKQSFVKTIFKSIIPTKARAWLRKRLATMNQKKLSQSNRLSLEEKKEIYNKYFNVDIGELETITGMNLKHWIYK